MERVSPVLFLGGIALLSGGLEANGWLERLARARGDRLATTGVYRYSRHPQYLGLIVAMTGVALVGRSGLALALCGALAAAALLLVPIEERRLERTFGEDYRR